MMEIKANDISRHFFQHQKEYEEKTLAVLRSGHYILGKEVKAFEDEFAGCMRAAFCVGLGNGLDALWLSFRILGIGKGDEVIVPANTYIASVMGITINGATPIFVEPDEFFTIDTKKIESKITGKTKAVLSVNLYGQACQMQELREICDRKHLFLVEDSAQSHGARYNDQFTNYYADISCFSFYPTKNLGCFGDGGAILTDHPEFADAFRIYRNYGSEKRYYNQVVGANSRLDEIQAGFLRLKLKYLSEINEERKLLAARYSGSISNPLITLPKLRPNTTSVWHQYVIDLRGAAFPAFESKEIRIPAGGNFLAITAESEAEQAATFEFLKFIMQPEWLAKWSENTGYMPPREDVSQNLQKMLTEGTVASLWQTAFSEMDGIRSWVSYPGDVGTYAEQLFADTRDAILGGKDIRTALTEAQDALNARLAEQ